LKDSKLNFKSAINSIAYRHSVPSVFTDFLELSICCLSAGALEDRYLSIVNRYQPNEIQDFAKAFAGMILEMGDLNLKTYSDPLGEFFEEFVTRGHNGQFFTPVTITELMAKISFSERTTGLKIADPACGSGRNLISAAMECGPSNSFYGADVDRNCAMMTAINLTLHGLPGEVSWMNSISNEWYGGWAIVNFPFPHLIEITEEASYIKLRLPEVQKEPLTINNNISFPINSSTQLTLF
jgi:type I restriction-modification system DNA methylase subunit